MAAYQKRINAARLGNEFANVLGSRTNIESRQNNTKVQLPRSFDPAQLVLARNDATESSRDHIDLPQTLHFSKLDEGVFGLYYAMSKDQSQGYKIMNYLNIIIQFLQMISISFNGTQWPLGVAAPYVRAAFSVIDLSISSSSQIALYVVFSLVCLFIIASLVTALVVGVLFRNNKSMPLFPLKVLRVLTISMVTSLYMPCVGIMLALLDCYYIGYPVPMHCVLPDVKCWAVPHVIPSVISIVVLLVFVPFSQFTSLFLFNNDPRKGGLLARPNGRFDFFVVRQPVTVHASSFSGAAAMLAQLLVKLTVVATTKLLTKYHDIRGPVSIIGYFSLALWCLWKQPYYSSHGNALYSALYASSGVSSAFATVAPLVTLGDTAGLVGFWVSYFLVMIIVPCAANILSRVRHRFLWALPRDGRLPAVFTMRRQQTDMSLMSMVSSQSRLPSLSAPMSPTASSNSSTIHPAGAFRLPRYRNASSLERGVRFLQEKQYRKQKDYVAYADFLYMEAFRKQRNNPSLHLSYAIFLLAFRKNFPRCMQQLQQSRQCYPSMDERFAIYVKSKDWEQQTAAGGDLRSANVMSVFTFKRHFSMAQKNHEAAKTALRDFCEALLAAQPDQGRIIDLTAAIVDSEAKARQYYELLLESHSNSVQVLRAYGSLLRDIYHDEDAAKVLLSRADLIEDDQLAARKQNLLPRFVLKLFVVHVTCLVAIIVSSAVGLYSIETVRLSVLGLDNVLAMQTLSANMAIDAKVLMAHWAALAPTNSTTLLIQGGLGSSLNGTVLQTVTEAREGLVAAAMQMRVLQYDLIKGLPPILASVFLETQDLTTYTFVTLDGANIGQRTLVSSLSSALDRYAELALDLAAQPLGTNVFFSDAQYLVANQPTGLGEYMKDTGQGFSDYLKAWVVAIEVILIATDVLAAALIAFVLVGFFASTTVKLAKGRDLALAHVLSIPKSTVRGMLQVLTAEPLDEAAAHAPRVRASLVDSTDTADPATPSPLELLPPPDRPAPAAATAAAATGPDPIASPPNLSLVPAMASPLLPLALPPESERDQQPLPGGPDLGPQPSTRLPADMGTHVSMEPPTLADPSSAPEASAATTAGATPVTGQSVLNASRFTAVGGEEPILPGPEPSPALTEWMSITPADPAEEAAPLPGSITPHPSSTNPIEQETAPLAEQEAAPLALQEDVSQMLQEPAVRDHPQEPEPPAAADEQPSSEQPPLELVPPASSFDLPFHAPGSVDHSRDASSLARAGSTHRGDTASPSVASTPPPMLKAASRSTSRVGAPADRYAPSLPQSGSRGGLQAAIGKAQEVGDSILQRTLSVQKQELLEHHCKEAAARSREYCGYARLACRMPVSVRLRIIIGTQLMLISLILSAIFTVSAQDAVASVGHPMALCGQQETQVAVVRLLATQLLFNSSLPLLDNPANPAATSPVWRDLSHLSNDRAALQRLLADEIDYLERLNFRLLYGTDASNATGDPVLDSKPFRRTIGEWSARETLLNTPQACLMRNETDCVAGRIRGLDGTLVGLAPLLARYMDAARQLSALPPGELTPTNPYFEFLFSAARYDLGDGMRTWTTSFDDQSEDDRSNASGMLTGWLAGDIVIIAFAFLAVLLPIKGLLWGEAHKTSKMFELFPEDAEPVRIVEWSDAYRVGLPALDADHQALVDLVRRLMEALAADDLEDSVPLVDQVWTAMSASLEAEERLMRAHRYPQRAAHLLAHATISSGLKRALEAIKTGQGGDGLLLQRLINDWLTGHVDQSDRAVARFLSAGPAATV
ncbi:hypothetical protein PAPYR_2325 [Paratrimastix pyriformis]|uniref:TmcB/TmcC TPR repeats domain-containing protein n=1 Tax=Paratrimastix pyriformis TaxID=342808 RepID=A0ABQ8URY5_9EUKA|nr:hypothetical protein PAPYR_2325 [Paratrimastix pyriformis]